MANNLDRPDAFEARKRGTLCVAAALACVASLSGCAAAQKKAVIPWKTAVLVRPVAPQQIAFRTVPDDPVPDLRLEIPPPPPPLAEARSVPPRPFVPTPTPGRSAPAEKPETPKFVPDLSAQDAASFQQQTEQSVSEAERNLASVNGKSLNATQSDLASKVRSFLADAKEAGKNGDWSRARDLARKAQVLSEELAGPR